MIDFQAQRWQRHGRWLALASGAAMPLSFAPFGLWWLAPVLLAVLFLATESDALRERAVRGFLFGFGCFSTGTYWLYISIHDIGGAAPPFAVAVCLLLIIVMACYSAAWAAAAGAVRRRTFALRQLVWLPASWIVVEWVRSWLFSGFPWLSLGYGQIDGPLAAWAPVLGVHGVSLAVALTAGALAVLVGGAGRERLAALAAALALLAGTVLVADWRWTQPDGEPLRVALVQGGISQDRKWQLEELERTKRLFLDLTLEREHADLVIWPEAAVPALDIEEEEFLRALDELGKARGQSIVLGILTFDLPRREYRNSLLALGAGSGTYHKRHLVPFGEYFPVPHFIRDFLRLMNLPYQDITAGADGQPPLRADDTTLAPSICYEDVFGAELRQFLPGAGVLVNVSNDGWFGDSIAPHQHLQMARFRALESGRPMLRSTNTGISAIIGPRGEVVARGPQFQAVVVEAEVRASVGATPWVRFGNGPVIGIAIVLVGALVPRPAAGRRRAGMMGSDA